MRTYNWTSSKIAGVSLILLFVSVEAHGGEGGALAAGILLVSATGWSDQSSPSDSSFEGQASNDLDKKIYVDLNKDQILIEMAIGRGEYLSSLAYLHGCPINTHDRFGEVIRVNYSHIFSEFELTTEDLINSIGAEINNDTQLTSQCTESML